MKGDGIVLYCFYRKRRTGTGIEGTARIFIPKQVEFSETELKWTNEEIKQIIAEDIAKAKKKLRKEKDWKKFIKIL